MSFPRFRIIFLFLFLFSIKINSQNLSFVDDTSQVRLFFIDGDTSYFLKTRPLKGSWIVYYDSAKTQVAFEALYPQNNINDYPFHRIDYYHTGEVKMSEFRDSLGESDCYNRRVWYPGGQLKYARICDGDTTKITEYYISGKIKKNELAFKDSLHGESMVPHYSISWHENGQIAYTPVDLNSNKIQVIMHYYASGKKKMEYSWKSHCYIGDYSEWYENGNLKVKGQYKDHNQENGIMNFFFQEGLWIYYNENGTKKLEINYNTDHSKTATHFDSKERKNKIEYYSVEGKLVKSEYYDEQGDLIRTEN